MAYLISRTNLHRFYPLKKNNSESPPFKVVYFTGAQGMSHLNSSLISLYRSWNKIPELYIVSDGTAVKKIQEALVSWPKKVTIESWEVCANHFRDLGNFGLYKYAHNNVLGKKLIGILYYSEKFPILYCDTDVLWFSYPSEEFNLKSKPFIKMGVDVGYFYDVPFLKLADEENIMNFPAQNSGVMFLSGDFSCYPKWRLLCDLLGEHTHKKGFSEQTFFAVLHNYFSPKVFFDEGEVLVKTDDKDDLTFTKKLFPDLYARHYTSLKSSVFWKDFIYLLYYN